LLNIAESGELLKAPQVQQTADVDERATLGPGTTAWHLAQIRENVRLGSSCIVGGGAYLGPGVIIGDNVKLQNHALVYEPARLEDDVFIGPAPVLTNDVYPRSVNVRRERSRDPRTGMPVASSCAKARQSARAP